MDGRSDVVARDYRVAGDVRAMQGLAQEIWSGSSRWHVGDLAYGRFQHLGREADWPTRLWERDGRVVAWGWVELPSFLQFQVHPGHAELAGAVLGWFDGVAAGGDRVAMVLETETALVEALSRHGYRDAGPVAPFFRHMSRELAALPCPVLPPGFTARPLRGEADAEARAAVHRTAFEGSRVTGDSYRAVMAAWPYRPGLDWLVEAPDGTPASYATLWLDPRHRVGLFEPVGTDPRFRGLGLARAVCLYGLHALAEAGASTAIVGPRGDDAHPVPARLYRSLGFRPGPRTRTYLRPSG